jgi:Coenzyme PQQ synthesis protein D (PqqD)
VKVDGRNQLPKARQEQLIIKELPDELLIYDLERDKAHCLNETAALVWKNCDGRKTVAQLREVMEKNTGTAVPEEMVWLALDHLETFKLLDKTPPKPELFAGMTRRDMVRRVGIAAIALPVILSIVAPTAQAQASGLAPGACCNSPGQCASGNCQQGGPCNTAPNSKSCV